MFKKLFSNSIVVKFIIVGTIGFFTNYAVLELALYTITDNKTLAAIIAMVVTINITFALHDKWTYVSRSDYYLSVPKRYLSYLTTNSSGAVITIVGFAVLSDSLPNIIALGISALAAMIWNFVMNLIVWRHRKGLKPSALIPPES